MDVQGPSPRGQQSICEYLDLRRGSLRARVAWGYLPGILASTAARGHQAALVVGGPPILGREKLVVPDIECALTLKEGAGTFGMVTFNSWEQWAFAPAILWRASRYARAAATLRAKPFEV